MCDELAKANSAPWYSHELKREVTVLRSLFDIEVEGHRREGRCVRIWNEQVREVLLWVCIKERGCFLSQSI